jgi:hypothetical protein
LARNLNSRIKALFHRKSTQNKSLLDSLLSNPS